jgi:DNA polymerase-3 subunit gamma/tau
MLPKLELSGMAYALASNCVLDKIEGNKVTLSLAANHQPMLNPKLKERLTESLSRVLNQTVQLEINISTAELATPSKQQQHENAQQLDAAKQNIMQDPKVKQLLDMYDATVEVEVLK